jgi:hypothetical protein
MTDTDDKAGLTVRITVNLRPDEYDELFRHVCRIGTNISASLRQSAAMAMKEERPIPPDRVLSARDLHSARLDLAPRDPGRSAAAAGRAERSNCARATAPPLAPGRRAGDRLRCLWPISADALPASCPRNPQALNATPKSCLTFHGRRPMAGSCRVSRFGNVTRWRVKPCKQD